MKRLTTIIVIFAALAAASCEKNTTSKIYSTTNNDSTHNGATNYDSLHVGVDTPFVVNDSLTGQWSVVSDSTYLEGTPLFPGGSKNYLGTASDYFTFTKNGNVFVKEGDNFDTAAYRMVAADTINFLYFYADGVGFGPNGAYAGNFVVTDLTPHTVTFILTGVISPEGRVFEAIKLKR